METTTLVTLVPHTCGECGCVFGLSTSHLRQLKETGDTWYCPNGHRRHFVVGETEEAKLRRRLERDVEFYRGRATHLEDQRAGAERSARAYRGHATRLRKRIAAGACPACEHTFPDLGEHMAAEHPGYGEDA